MKLFSIEYFILPEYHLDMSSANMESTYIYYLNRWADFEKFCFAQYIRSPSIHPCAKESCTPKCTTNVIKIQLNTTANNS